MVPKKIHKFEYMERVDIKLYTAVSSPRLEYVAGVVLRDLLGLSFQVVTDRRKIGNSPFLNYSAERLPEAFNVKPEGILSETGIRADDPPAASDGGLMLLFPSDSPSDLPFDIFAASFWMLTRYEEYRKFGPDRHGRFMAEDSLAFRLGFLRIPVVELWARRLALALLKKIPFLAFRRNRFRSVVTFDIDQAYAYRGKGVLRGAAGFMSDLVKGAGMERLRSLSGTDRDPYDVYDYIFEAVDNAGAEALFFLPFGSWSEYDRNNPAGSKIYGELVRRITSRYNAGIHFSYNSGHDGSLMKKERERFARVTGIVPSVSRQHYLVLRFPDTCRWLHANGIKTDYTLGYPSLPGFRAGISVPFRFYDLVAEKETALVMSPFAIMDVTLKDYMKLDVQKAKSVITETADSLVVTGGVFLSIWHNSSLTERNGWEGWREVFEHTLLIGSGND